MSRTIFYSWQSDIEPNKHQYFIERCFKDALDELEQSANIYMNYDRDTARLNGSPDISQAIFEKIEKCILFVCDVSIINSIFNGKKTPNPNVLIELGYAVNKLGWDRIICLFDSNTGKIEELPFDIRQKRVTVFNPEKGKAEGNTVVVIEHNLDLIKNADYIIDLGYEGGEAGSEVICTGTPEQIADCKESYIGKFLKNYLGGKGDECYRKTSKTQSFWKWENYRAE